MRTLQTPTERRAGQWVALAILLTVLATLSLLVVPRAAQTLTGIPPAARITAPDDLRAASGEDPTAFLAERDQIELRVAEATTLREFLDRNRLNKPAQSRQIMEQLGNTNPDARIAAGTTFRIRLTPSARDVPGASR